VPSADGSEIALAERAGAVVVPAAVAVVEVEACEWASAGARSFLDLGFLGVL
jgi:hypothetical protein